MADIPKIRKVRLKLRHTEPGNRWPVTSLNFTADRPSGDEAKSTQARCPICDRDVVVTVLGRDQFVGLRFVFTSVAVLLMCGAWGQSVDLLFPDIRDPEPAAWVVRAAVFAAVVSVLLLFAALWWPGASTADPKHRVTRGVG